MRRKVKSASTESPSDVVVHALYLLEACDRFREAQLDALRREVAIGIEQCERGETEPSPTETVRRIASRVASGWQRRRERLEPRPIDLPRTPSSRSMKQPRLTDRAEVDIEEC